MRVVLYTLTVSTHCTFTFLFLLTPPTSHTEHTHNMDSDSVVIDSDMAYPILFIPKKYTTLETNCEFSDNVYIDVNISSTDTEGNETSIYKGYCNVKLMESFDVNHYRSGSSSPGSIEIDQMPVIFSEASQMYPPYSQSQVWIDPSRSPYVYNHYDPASHERYSIRESGGLITVEQHNTYITQNVYNRKGSNVFNYNEPQSPVKEGECKRYRKVQESVTGQSDTNQIYNEEDEFECGVFLSQLPEEIMNDTQTRIRDEKNFSNQQENNALKQLMSSDIQSSSKQRKTILYLGHDSHSGQTIQNISYNDPQVKCSEVEVDNEVVIDDTTQPNPKKKYQCDKCKKLFDQISSFRQHMVVNHSQKRAQPEKDISFVCTDCGKNLKNQRKFEIHCLGHGDPDLECQKCRKVFASKFSLRVHMKIHNRKYQCNYCVKSYGSFGDLKSHSSKAHFLFMCDDENCSFVTHKASNLEKHQHRTELNDDSTKQYVAIHIENPGDFKKTLKTEAQNLDQELLNSDFVQESLSEMSSIDFIKSQMKDRPRKGSKSGSKFDLAKSSEELEKDFVVPSEAKSDKNVSEEDNEGDRIRKADSVIATVMTNSIFLLSSDKARKHRYRKSCVVCQKSFDRTDDLKRHLIEHVIRSTLAKTPVTLTGSLNITCEVCQTEVFYRVDKYKEHLREHAKLTIYRCTFCDKSFSDSSNFSKHKKIHGVSYLQCDLCQRKFNSKKMIALHMDHHKKTKPVKCSFCNRMFHFASMLNKHVRSTHRKEENSKYRCRFCVKIYRSVKEKLEHEWQVHNVRKMKVDCPVCGAQYRKYSELKRHCLDAHRMDIPTAQKLLKRRYTIAYDLDDY